MWLCELPAATEHRASLSLPCLFLPLRPKALQLELRGTGFHQLRASDVSLILALNNKHTKKIVLSASDPYILSEGLKCSLLDERGIRCF